jgi:hypothetical protein
MEFELKDKREGYKKCKATESPGVKREPQSNTGSTLWPSIISPGLSVGPKII